MLSGLLRAVSGNSSVIWKNVVLVWMMLVVFTHNLKFSDISYSKDIAMSFITASDSISHYIHMLGS
jgi:hypothetical protein